MSERSQSTLWIVGLVLLAAVLTALIATAPSTTDRVESIGQRIKCPVCQGESIADSPAEMAVDMMSLVRQRVEEGRSDEDIVTELLSGYSGAVLLDPPVQGATLVLWLAPIAALAAGLGVIAWWRSHSPAEAPPGHVRSPRRGLTVAGLVAAFAATIVVAALFVQDRQGAASGVADSTVTDLDDVSNETMEAVIAENADNAQINGMRLALAERYYSEGDYSSAFPHYLSVADSPTATQQEVVAALVRLGWMAWDGNGAADAAIGLFDEALSLDAGSTTARFLKSRVLWCTGERSAAETILSDLLEDPSLPSDSRAGVESDLASIRSGAVCT